MFGLRPVTDVINSLGSFFTTGLSGEEELKLITENQRLKAENIELNNLREQNLLLQKTLGFKEEKKLSLKGGRVTYYGRELGREFIFIDQGQKDGIIKDDLVLNPNGFFIGTVVDAEGEYAKIEAASNLGMVFEVEIGSSKIKSLAKGLGSGGISLELIPAEADVQPGDTVLLTGVGTGGGERYALPLGEVVRVKINGGSAFKEARARALVPLASSREIFITPAGNLP